MPSLYAIAVIGQRGQLVSPADTPWFKEMTWGKLIISSGSTPVLTGRSILVDEVVLYSPETLREFVRNSAVENVVLIGGAETFAKFAGVVDRWYIDKTSYDGPSDEWFNPMRLVAESC